ncbi:MAG TPA: tetratricopeptide repeat protein [Bryobacteraceae bacterium]|nr:tetratricopeptide repeat protein [Bryobacteraceae bacterium]
MARITRKELKTDRFALEVEHSLTFFEEHQKEVIRYGVAGVGVILLIVGGIWYSRHQHTLREEVLARAIQIQESPVGPPTPGQNQNFPTQDAKDEVALKAFGDLASKYSGSDEGEIALYYLGSIKADQGKLAEAEKNFKEVADKGNAKYASLAKYALAQIYFADGRDDQGESTLRDLIAHPTIYVSKEMATITLARAISRKKPAEARKLLDPLRSQQGAVGQAALSAYADLPPQ